MGDLAAPPPPPRARRRWRGPAQDVPAERLRVPRAPRKSQSRATVQRFLDLALVAHDLNIRAQEKLKAGVRGVLAEVPGGRAEETRVLRLRGVPAAGPRHAAPARVRRPPRQGRARRRGGRAICTEALHALAAETFEPSARAARWALVADRAGLRLRCEDATSIKRTARMRGQAGEENAGQCARAEISDCLRATVVCDSAASLVGAYEALAATAGFRALRLKNKVALLQGPSASTRTSSSTAAAPVVVEVQSTPALVDATVWATPPHLRRSRAPTWQALRESQTAGDPALGAAASIIKSQLESSAIARPRSVASRANADSHDAPADQSEDTCLIPFPFRTSQRQYHNHPRRGSTVRPPRGVLPSDCGYVRWNSNLKLGGTL